MVEAYVILTEGIHEKLCKEEGMGMVELALIIIILIGLALIFKTQIEAFMDTIFKEFNIDGLK